MLTGKEIRKVLKVKGSKVYGSIVISEHDSIYIELKKSEVYSIISDMEKHSVSFDVWSIHKENVFIN